MSRASGTLNGPEDVEPSARLTPVRWKNDWYFILATAVSMGMFGTVTFSYCLIEDSSGLKTKERCSCET